MTDEPETIEAEVEETLDLVPAPAGPQVPATLFHTDDPVLVIQKATDVANALANAVRNIKDDKGKPKLISIISGREHVRVEGWTLLGSMLGVFPVPVWTRKLENPEGWEARVEARTLQGNTIGAAEAQCTRAEKMWGYEPIGRDGRKLEARDDFALRSMAQTRATSKCLRLPLGFVMTLAGFDATPAEEISESPEPQPTRQDPTFPVPKSWAEIEKGVKIADNPEEAWALFSAFTRACSYHLFGKIEAAELVQKEKDTLYQKAAGAVVWLAENVEYEGPFRFYDESKERQAWASVLDGTLLAIPDYEAPEPEAPVDPEAERLARETLADDYAG